MSSFFAYPMRIFFIISCAFAFVAGLGLFLMSEFFIYAHQFLFLQSFTGAAFAGFLLTAMPLWCKVSVNLKPLSALLLALLCLALLAHFWGFGYEVMSLFWLLLLASCLVWVIRSKSSANLSLVFLLLGLFALTLAKIFSAGVRLDYAYLHLCVLGIVMISLKISVVLGNDALKGWENGRNLEFSSKNAKNSNSLPKNAKNSGILPNFSNENSQNLNFLPNLASENARNLSFLPNVALKNVSCFLLAALAAGVLLDINEKINGFFALAVGFSLFSRLANWHYAVFFKTHYTLILYLLFVGASTAYIALGVVYFVDSAYASFAMHFISVLVLLGFVFFVFNTASLKHTQNQAFVFSLGTKVSFLGLFVAALCRGVLAFCVLYFANLKLNFADFARLDFGLFYITIPALTTAFAFLYFALKFAPIYKNNDFKGDDE